MNQRTQFVYDLALSLAAQKATITGAELAERANNAGIRTSYGAMYAGRRGTYTLIRCTYAAVLRDLGHDAAEVVAAAFVKSDGRYAYL